jgi:hypothetical protein
MKGELHMDEKKLSQIANLNATAKAVFKVFKERDRNPREGMMDTRRVRYELEQEGVKVVPQEFVEVFKNLEKAGVGKLITEKGKPMTFKWHTSMKDVAAMALVTGGTVTHAESSKQPSTNHHAGVVAVLPSGREVPLSLPNDLSQEDAQALCKMIMRRAR